MKGSAENKRRYCHPLPDLRGTHFQNAAYSVRVAASSRYITSLTAEELCDLRLLSFMRCNTTFRVRDWWSSCYCCLKSGITAERFRKLMIQSKFQYLQFAYLGKKHGQGLHNHFQLAAISSKKFKKNVHGFYKFYPRENTQEILLDYIT